MWLWRLAVRFLGVFRLPSGPGHGRGRTIPFGNRLYCLLLYKYCRRSSWSVRHLSGMRISPINVSLYMGCCWNQYAIQRANTKMTWHSLATRSHVRMGSSEFSFLAGVCPLQINDASTNHKHTRTCQGSDCNSVTQSYRGSFGYFAARAHVDRAPLICSFSS